MSNAKPVTETINDGNQKQIELLLATVNKEFQHLLHVEKRTNITLTIAGFLLSAESVGYAIMMSQREAILKVYPLFITLFPSVYLFPAFISAVVSLIILVWAVTKAIYIGFSKKGIISHHSIVWGTPSHTEYVKRLKTVMQNKGGLLFNDLAFYVRSLALLASVKKRFIHSVTCLLLLSIIWVGIGISVSLCYPKTLPVIILAFLGGTVIRTGVKEFYQALKTIRIHYKKDRCENFNEVELN